jgi:sugar lactone lactonase YvrE
MCTVPPLRRSPWLLLLLSLAGCGNESPPPAHPPAVDAAAGASIDARASGGGLADSGATAPMDAAGDVSVAIDDDAGPPPTTTPEAGAVEVAATDAPAAEASPGDGPAVDAAPALGPFPAAAVRAARPESFARIAAHTEGPSWRNGELYFAADGSGLMRVDANRRLSRYHPRLTPVGSYALADGRLLVCDKTFMVVQVDLDGKVSVLPNQFQGRMIGFCNDLTVDAAGNVYFTDARAGDIYRISPAGDVARVLGGDGYPNGVEVDPASKYLYFTRGGQLWRMTLPADGGTGFGSPTSVAGVRGDGMTFDAWGNLWIAQPSTDRIAVYAPETDKVLLDIAAGGNMPTNLTFGGPDRDVLFVTLSGVGVSRIAVGAKGFLHPGAPQYKTVRTLDYVPGN